MESTDRRRPTLYRTSFLAIIIVIVFGGCGLLASLAIFSGLAPLIYRQAAAPAAIAPAETTPPAPAVLPGSQPETPPVTPSPTPADVLLEIPNVAPQSSGSQVTGLPEDIPIPVNVDSRAVVGRPDSFSFLTGMTYGDTLAFYQQQLAAWEWVKVDYGTRIGQAGAELHYTKGARRLTVRIASVPYVGTVVEISVRV